MATLAMLQWLVVIVVSGVIGSLLIMRHFPGRRALGAYILWLPVPFVVLALIIAANSDPTLTSSKATYNFQLAFVLASFAITIPWLGANLVGGILGRRTRKCPAVPTAVAGYVAPPADPDLPDWSHPDSPLHSEPEIGARMRAIAAQAGIPDRVLPSLTPPFGREGGFAFRDRFDYVYTALERGAPMFEHRTAVVDELLYLIFKDRSWMVAAGYVADAGAPPERDSESIAQRQQAMLAGIDPRWGRQFVLDLARKAGG